MVFEITFRKMGSLFAKHMSVIFTTSIYRGVHFHSDVTSHVKSAVRHILLISAEKANFLYIF